MASGSGPADMREGPDGNIWFIENSSAKVARITPTGTLTEFPIVIGGTPGRPVRIVVGPDGNLWFTVQQRRSVGRITTAGVMTLFTLSGRPRGITVGSDGNLWAAEIDTGFLAKITTSGSITEFPTFASTDGPWVLATGSDGNLWVTLAGDPSLGFPGSQTLARVVIATQAVTRFTIPGSGSFANYIISSGSNLYFADDGSAPGVGISTTAGAINELALPGGPGFLTTGPDGHIWFTDEGCTATACGVNPAIGRINASGAIVEFPTTAGGLPAGITSGPSSTIWFTDHFRDKVDEFTVSAATASSAEVTRQVTSQRCLTCAQGGGQPIIRK